MFIKVTSGAASRSESAPGSFDSVIKPTRHAEARFSRKREAFQHPGQNGRTLCIDRNKGPALVLDDFGQAAKTGQQGEEIRSPLKTHLHPVLPHHTGNDAGEVHG